MKSLILGPTKTRVLDTPPDEVIARLTEWADSNDCPFTVSHRGRHFQFAPHPADKRQWSPHLTLEVLELATLGHEGVETTAPVSPGAGTLAEHANGRLGPHADPRPHGVPDTEEHDHPGATTMPGGIGTGRTEVFGRFNPSPGIWTGYMLATLSLITIIIGALGWAWAELVIDQPPRALWAIPACVAVLVVMWSISAVGQRLAADQMRAMWAGVERAIREDDDPARPQTPQSPQTPESPPAPTPEPPHRHDPRLN